MKTIMMTAVSAAMLAGAANAAEPRYDRNLEKAAAEIAAAKMGAIRGGFAFADKPQFVVAPAAPAVSVSRAEPAATADDGLMPAVERPVQRSVN